MEELIENLKAILKEDPDFQIEIRATKEVISEEELLQLKFETPNEHSDQNQAFQVKER